MPSPVLAPICGLAMPHQASDAPTCTEPAGHTTPHETHLAASGVVVRWYSPEPFLAHAR